MSQIKTTELEGDVAIGRHVTAGGNATIQGNATVKRNLRIEGWLEAKNIKGANKGLFLNVTKLREACPLPHDGWWALVGDSLPAPLYIADGGEWVATGKTAGDPNIDISEVGNLSTAIIELEIAIQTISSSLSELETICGTATDQTLTDGIDNLKEAIAYLSDIKDDEKLIEQLTAIKKDFSDLIKKLDTYSKSQQGITDRIDGINVFPFDGFCYTGMEIADKPDGYIAFSIQEGLFVTVSNRAVTRSVDGYNINDSDIVADRIFRQGGTLYTRSGRCELTKYVTEASLANSLADRPRVVAMTEDDFDRLMQAGDIDNEVIYMTYEAE